MTTSGIWVTTDASYVSINSCENLRLASQNPSATLSFAGWPEVLKDQIHVSLSSASKI